MIATIEGIENKLAGIDSTIVAYVTAAIDALKIGDYAKAADLTALAERVDALEKKPFDTYATKTEVEAVDAKFADYTKTSDLTDLLADKADADKVVANDTFETFKTANDAAIEAARTGAVADVAEVGYALADDVAETYATKQSVTDLGNTVDTKLNDYAKTADVETELAKKVDTATISHTTEETAEGATVSGTTLNIVVDAFTKAETRQYVADTISQMTGGESAADVLLALNNYKSDNDERVGAIETKNGEQDTAIKAAQDQADKGVADAKTANDAITALTTGPVATNTGDITAIKGRLDTLETAKGNHEQRLTTAESKISALEAADAVINETLGTINGNITALTNKDAELAGLIQSNTNKFADYYTASEVDTKVQEAIDAIPDVDLTAYAKTADVTAAIKVETDRALAAEKVNADAINALVGDDKDMTIRAIAAAETAKIVAGADTKYDTLKEIADFIINDETGAAAMANDIAALKAKVDTGDLKVSEYVAAQIAAIPATPVATTEIAGIVKASEDINVAADGKMTVARVSTDALVQGTDTLVLNGGNAGVAAAE
jgi:hypothetical protein